MHSFTPAGLIRGHLRSVTEEISLLVWPGRRVAGRSANCWVRIAGFCLHPIQRLDRDETAAIGAWAVDNVVDRKLKNGHSISHTGA